MTNIKEIFGRSNIREIAHYLVNGAKSYEKSDKDYDARIEAAYQKYEAIALGDDKKKPVDLLDYANEMTSTIGDVYFEIGIQTGILMVADILKNIERDYPAMYFSLFHNVTMALEYLQEKDNESIEKAITILKESQCKTEEIYMNTGK